MNRSVSALSTLSHFAETLSGSNCNHMYETNQKNDGDYSGRVGLVYARVSSVGQANYGHGLESQEARCVNELKSLGVTYSKSFLDSFTGGGDFMKRPAMRDLLAYVDKNPHQKFVVVFDDLKRFARDVEFHIKLRAAFRVRNVALRCLNYNFDDSPEGEFAEIVMAGQAQLERKQNRRQVIQKQRARMEAGHWPLAARKGYSRNPASRILEPNKQGLEVLKPALEGFATGNLARKIDVCEFLVERGFWKKQTPDKYIHRVDAILRDPFYCGDVEYLPWDVSRRKGEHDGIISSEMFERIQRRLKSRGATTRVRRDISEDFPLRGLVLCSSCGHALTGAFARGRSRRYSYYYCKDKKCSLYSKMLHGENVERDFRALLMRNRLKADVSKVVQVVFDRVWNQEVGELQQQKRRVERRKTELETEIADLSLLARRAQSEAVQRGYEGQMERAVKELESINPCDTNDLAIPYRTALTKIQGLLENPIVIWDCVDVLERHRLFFFLFEEKLPYIKNEGYRTGDSLSTTRLFEEFATTNPHFVDPRGVEPRPVPCHGTVLPLYYGPD